MSALAEGLAVIERDAAKGQKVLVLDIETSPTLTYTFGMRPKWISPEKIVEPSRMLCWGAKWLGTERILFASEFHHGREKMLTQLWDLLTEASAVITFNGNRFDFKRINGEFLLAGMPPASPFRSIDLYVIAGQRYDLESRSLNHLAQRLGVGEKVAHEGFGLWKSCLEGDRAAWGRMKAYQLGDIKVTEAVYWALLSWIHNHPALYITDDERPTCNRCPDGGDLQPSGVYLADRLRYRQYQCSKCQGWSRGVREVKGPLARGVK